jgi:hypothetical protein
MLLEMLTAPGLRSGVTFYPHTFLASEDSAALRFPPYFVGYRVLVATVELFRVVQRRAHDRSTPVKSLRDTTPRILPDRSRSRPETGTDKGGRLTTSVSGGGGMAHFTLTR